MLEYSFQANQLILETDVKKWRALNIKNWLCTIKPKIGILFPVSNFKNYVNLRVPVRSESFIPFFE